MSSLWEQAQRVLSPTMDSIASNPASQPHVVANVDERPGSTFPPSAGGASQSPYMTFSPWASSPSLLMSFFQLGALGSLLQFLGIAETISWLWSSLYQYILGRFILTVHLTWGEQPTEWMMVWLSKQKNWNSSRTVDVSTVNFGLTAQAGSLIPGEDTKGKEGQAPLSIVPSKNVTQTLWYKGTIVRVVRERSRTVNDLDFGSMANSNIVITMYTRRHETFYDLLREAKEQYNREIETRVVVYIVDLFSNWLYMGSRPKRSLDSVVIPEDVKTLLYDDVRDFLDSEQWYGDRGIPWQRGWLFYGSPGSGKTSTIQALAGELGLPIYVLSLSKKGLDDAALNTLMSGIPSKSIILMEDIDAAFTQSINRESAPPAPTSPPSAAAEPTSDSAPVPPRRIGWATGMGLSVAPSVSSLTLSGLLNAIDGVQAQQGRLLFATTNKYDALDPALVRPGRLDLHVEFKRATKWQAEELFKRFYPVVDPDSTSSSAAVDGTNDVPSRQASMHESDVPVDYEQEVKDLIKGAKSAQQRGRKAPRLSPRELGNLAKKFADAIPDYELSMAAIQGHLMMYKARPHMAVRMVPSFLAQEQERRTKRNERPEAPESTDVIIIEEPNSVAEVTESKIGEVVRNGDVTAPDTA